MIREMFLARIMEFAPATYDRLAEIDLSHYHRHAHCLDHAAAWPRHVRLFSNKAIAFIQSSSLIRQLEAAFGKAVITNEVEDEAPEVVWRLVRPNRSEDVGPIHADGWFWEINRWTVPIGFRRVKIWTMVYGEPGRAGLSVVPGSHRDGPWPHGMERRHGLDKPVFDVSVLGDRRPVLLDTQPGTSVVFHDALLHGGAVTGGDQCRVSFEFTLFVPMPEKSAVTARKF
jgi:hypothetical protein